MYYYKEFISSLEKATRENISLERKEEIKQERKQILDTIEQALDIIFSDTYAKILTYENVIIFEFLHTLYDKHGDDNYPKEKKKYSKEEMVGIIDYICNFGQECKLNRIFIGKELSL